MDNNIKEIYSDGIGKIHFFGGTIRLDLFSFEPSDKENENPIPRVTKRIVMSPNAFLSSYESFVNMVEKLKEAGVISDAPESNADTVTDSQE